MLSANNILKICIFLSVFVYSTQGSKSQSEEKKINIKIGFDLTQGENGAPSLKIRDFEKESAEVQLRANEGKDKQGPSVRADSFSDNSDEKGTENKPKDSSKENAPAGRQGESKESDSDEDSDEKRGISTRGMDVDEYEPEAVRLGREKPGPDKSKESKSSSGEDSASGGDKEETARRNKKGVRRQRDEDNRRHEDNRRNEDTRRHENARRHEDTQHHEDNRRHEDAPNRAKRNVPTLKGLMENIRKRTRELFVADRRQAEMKAKKS